MEIFIKILQFIVSFSLLVFVHEFGHFITARMCKIRVDKFYIFFNPWFSLFKFKKGDTEYGIGWLPFGGYCKIAGMIDESMDTEQMKQPPQPYEFRSKSPWARLLVMVGGVLMNIILAVFIYIGMSWAWGESYIATKDAKYGYVYSELAQNIGFRNGDQVVDVAGEAIENALMVHSAIIFDQAPYVTVLRDGQQMRIAIPQDSVAALIRDGKFMELRLPFVLGSVLKNSGASAAGLQEGDALIALNGEPMRFFDEYQKALAQHKGQTVTVEVTRDSAGITRTFPQQVAVSEEGTIGVQMSSLSLPVSTHNYSFWQSIPRGISRTGQEIANYGKQLKLIFSPKTEVYKSLGGVIAIGSIFPREWDWYAFWQITAFLSIMLAIINILPIPMLDGGHVLFVLIEIVTGRKPSDKVLEVAQYIGLILILGLMVFANGNDIYRFFIK